MKTRIILLVAGFFALILIVSSFSIIGPGQRGVLVQLGAPQEHILTEGFNFKTPFIQTVVTLDVKTQKEQVEVSAASKDLQTVTAVVALNYHLEADKVNKLYQNIGIDYKERIIDPAVQEAIKATTANFTAEELITKRPLVKEEAKKSLTDRLANEFIRVDELSIVDFDFSESFNDAIEAKVTAEQNALAAKNKLEQVKFEAQQKIETAKADAESIRIQAQALAQNQELVKLKAVEKWDGKLPTYMMGSATPFIDVTK